MKIIESITIRYFRSVYTIQLKQCQDLTVITGKNDVGKSNILKALNLFFCNQSDYLQNFSFNDDYSITRKEEVRKDTIRGQQFISITISFLRGNRMLNSLPPKFSVTKRWDMHSNECKVSSDVQTRMQRYTKEKGIKYSEKTTTTSLSTFLNKIKFVYVPAIKDEHVFGETLNTLQQNLFDSKNKRILDYPIGEANKAIQEIIGTLQSDFETATGIQNFVELPTTLNYTNGLLQINTRTANGSVTIDKRGDGIRTHYIPKILHYVATHSNNMYIWGFEEPENSYEYRRCIQVAKEFEEEYSNCSQVFLTSHSPAFFTTESEKKAIVRVGNDQGRTVLLDSSVELDEELGYIELYRDFLTKMNELQERNAQHLETIGSLTKKINVMTVPILLTEGKTDTELLKLAIQKLGLVEYEKWEIQPATSGDNQNNDALLRYLGELRDNSRPVMPVIGMFDRDTKLPITIDGEKIDIRDKDYVKIADGIYAFAIPVPHHREEADQISIEHYFTDSEIRTEHEGKRLFLGKEFYDTGVFIGDEELFYKNGRNVAGTIKIIEHESRNYVTKTDGTGDYSISKAAFVDCIKEARPGFENISFEEFRKIFGIIGQIISSYQSEGNENDQL